MRGVAIATPLAIHPCKLQGIVIIYHKMLKSFFESVIAEVPSS